MGAGSVISLFTGGMGLDLGFDLEGFKVVVAVEKDPAAVATIRANRPGVKIPLDGNRPISIEGITTGELLDKAELQEGEAMAVIGAPPCEPYSTAGRRNGKADHRADAVMQFIRVIKEARPRYFVMEEVESFLSAARRHIPFYDRIRIAKKEIDDDLRLGSFFEDVMKEFKQTGYILSYEEDNPKASVLNAADFGVPQKRKRFILIGSRDGPAVALPSPTYARSQWVTLGEALDDLSDPDPEYKDFPKAWGQYLHRVPEGGCWRDLPEDMQRLILGGAYDDPANERTKGKKGGRTGFMRRLSRAAPSPTLVDSPTTKASCLCHPTEDRPLSIREYARIQGFRDDWEFRGSVAAKYRLIGQATPVQLARAVARAVKRAATIAPEAR